MNAYRIVDKKSCQRSSNQVERLSKIESSDDRSYLQVYLWRSTSRKMTQPLFLFATFYMSGAVWGHVGPKCYTTNFEPIVSLWAVLTWKRRLRTPYHIHIPNPKCVKIPWVLAPAKKSASEQSSEKNTISPMSVQWWKKVSLLNHHNPNCSGVPQNLTWCQWFGETKIHATKKAILRCFDLPKQFSWPGAQCLPKTMILWVNLRYFGTLYKVHPVTEEIFFVTPWDGSGVII